MDNLESLRALSLHDGWIHGVAGAPQCLAAGAATDAKACGPAVRHRAKRSCTRITTPTSTWPWTATGCGPSTPPSSRKTSCSSPSWTPTAWRFRRRGTYRSVIATTATVSSCAAFCIWSRTSCRRRPLSTSPSTCTGRSGCLSTYCFATRTIRTAW